MYDDFEAIVNNKILLSSLNKEQERMFWIWYEEHFDNKGNRITISKKEQRRQICIRANNIKLKNLTLEHKKEIYAKVVKSNTGKKHNFKDKESWRQNIKNAWNSKSDKDIELMKNKISKANKRYYRNLSDEHKKELSNIHSQCLLNLPKNKKLEISNKIKQNWKNKSELEKSLIRQKQSNTWKNKTREEINYIMTKSHNAKKNNNSYGKSNLEQNFYNYCKENKIDISWQHNENGLSFDFLYIVDNKINYIELNGVYWHNYRPYADNLQNQKEYNILVQKGGQFENIANKWKYYDVRKLQYCKENNLNFICIYYKNNSFYNRPNLLLDLIQENCNKGIRIILSEEVEKYVMQMSNL